MANEAEKLMAAVQNQRIYKVGASPLVWGIMETLGIEELTDEQCLRGDQTISHGRTTVGLVLNRLIKPKAMYKVGEWLGKTGLADWLGRPAEEFNDDRLGRTLDALSDQTEDLWMKIVGRALKSYPKLAGEFIHYDLTSCYFEGKYAESELATYGYSRDHRSDTKQVNLGVSVIGESKLPLMYELLAGNTTDCKTPLQHVTKLKRLFSQVKYPHRVVFVGDRAMFNQELIEGYLKADVLFLGPWTPPDVRTLMQAATNAELMEHPLSFQPQSARANDPPTYYGVLRTFDFATDDQSVPLQVLIVYSRGKAKLDRQLRDNHLDQTLTRLADIQTKLNRRRYKREAYVRQQLAHTVKKFRAAQGLIHWTLTGTEGDLTLTFARDEAAIAAAAQVDGRYALVTNAPLSADKMLIQFKAQCCSEHRFSILKGPVPLRPIHLRTDRRITALVFLTMLALLVYAILEWLIRQSTAQRKRPWTGRAILETFEDFALTVLLFPDGSVAWLPPPFSETQQTLWDALHLPDVSTFFAQIGSPRFNCGT
ncbi:MAG: IS1634 family transposase [Chloroflexi bacterium]|nr:IS1634 family transposase [Chloroflexota bacterium]